MRMRNPLQNQVRRRLKNSVLTKFQSDWFITFWYIVRKNELDTIAVFAHARSPPKNI